MMTILIVFAAAAQAYLLGSIDTGILVSKYLYHDDVRNYGSGAAGMTNMLRTFGKKAAALTAENIYTQIITANAQMDDAEVPASDRVLILTPTAYTLLKQSKATFDNQDIGAELRKKGVIAQLDGLNVVKIASNRLPEKFGFMIAHPVATVAPVKLAEYKIHLDPPFLSGSLVEGRIYYDAFVLENKAKAIYYQAIA